MKIISNEEAQKVIGGVYGQVGQVIWVQRNRSGSTNCREAKIIRAGGSTANGASGEVETVKITSAPFGCVALPDRATSRDSDRFAIGQEINLRPTSIIAPI